MILSAFLFFSHTGTAFADAKSDVDGNQQSCPTTGKQCNAKSGCGNTSTCSSGASGCVGDYFWAVGSAESGNSYSICNTHSPPCCGWIQFCGTNLTTAEATCGGSQSNFFADAGECQDNAIINYTHNNWNGLLSKGLGAYLCKTVTIKGVSYKITQGGLLGASNLCGPGNTHNFIVNGVDHCDMYGTCCSTYFLNFNSTTIPSDLSWADNSCPAQPPSCTSGSGGGGGGGSPPPVAFGPCGDPQLTGQFAQDPCGLTPAPGFKFATYLNNWWANSLLPALKDMTAQLYSYRIFETWQLGRSMDAADTIKAARAEEEQRLTAHQGVTPNSSTCIAGSFVSALSQTQLTSTQLTHGFIEDLERRAQGAVETPTGSPPSYTPPGLTPAFDISRRWTQYCDEFYDPQSNDGHSACPGSPTSPPAGGVMNGDIDVENFMLRDTIDMNDPHQYAATKAILENLVAPTIIPRVPEAVINTPQGQTYIIQLQHLEAINNIAASVVGGILSRRAALPVTSTTIAKQILSIRKAAGIPACSASPAPPPGTTCASSTPSYNEIMEAMTKERFFDPKYFTRVQNDIGAIKQEQASVDAYTTVQMQDIHQLQEQINALLAARAALKLGVADNSNMSQSAPQK